MMPSDQWTFVPQDDALEDLGLPECEPLGLPECAEQEAMHIVENPWDERDVDTLENRATELDPKWHTDHEDDLTKMLEDQHYLP